MTALFEQSAEATESIEFFVPGLPQPGGSKRAFYIEKLKRAIVTDDNPKAKDWKRTVAVFAQQNYIGALLEGPLRVEMRFVMPRVQAHFRSNGELKPVAPRFHTKKPDALKLGRSTEDALTGIVWRDDSQIACEYLEKTYGDKTGAFIRITKL